MPVGVYYAWLKKESERQVKGGGGLLDDLDARALAVNSVWMTLMRQDNAWSRQVIWYPEDPITNIEINPNGTHFATAIHVCMQNL